jgi:hypothetical protein
MEKITLNDVTSHYKPLYSTTDNYETKFLNYSDALVALRKGPRAFKVVRENRNIGYGLKGIYAKIPIDISLIPDDNSESTSDIDRINQFYDVSPLTNEVNFVNSLETDSLFNIFLFQDIMASGTMTTNHLYECFSTTDIKMAPFALNTLNNRITNTFSAPRRVSVTFRKPYYDSTIITNAEDVAMTLRWYEPERSDILENDFRKFKKKGCRMCYSLFMHGGVPHARVFSSYFNLRKYVLTTIKANFDAYLGLSEKIDGVDKVPSSLMTTDDYLTSLSSRGAFAPPDWYSPEESYSMDYFENMIVEDNELSTSGTFILSSYVYDILSDDIKSKFITRNVSVVKIELPEKIDGLDDTPGEGPINIIEMPYDDEPTEFDHPTVYDLKSYQATVKIPKDMDSLSSLFTLIMHTDNPIDADEGYDDEIIKKGPLATSTRNTLSQGSNLTKKEGTVNYETYCALITDIILQSVYHNSFTIDWEEKVVVYTVLDEDTPKLNDYNESTLKIAPLVASNISK